MLKHIYLSTIRSWLLLLPVSGQRNASVYKLMVEGEKVDGEE